MGSVHHNPGRVPLEVVYKQLTHLPDTLLTLLRINNFVLQQVKGSRTQGRRQLDIDYKQEVITKKFRYSPDSPEVP